MGDARRAWLIVAALAIVSAVGSLVVGRAFFEDLSLNNDEAVYVLQAEMFAGGELVLSDSLHGDAFRPWMSGRVGDDRLVLVEQPTLVALMAASQRAFGTMRIALALIAATSVVSIFVATRRLVRDQRVALFAAACFTFSPLVIVQSALYVSYLLSITLAAFAIAALTRATDEPGSHPQRWFVLGGGLVGLVLLTRPLEGIVLSALVVPWIWARSGERSRALRSIPFIVAGSAPVLLAALVYNSCTTGDPFTFALWTIGGDDSFGFGHRAIAEHSQHIYVGPGEAWLALRTNLRAFPHWLFAGIASVPLAAWGAWQLRRRAPKVLWAMLLLGAAYPIAYFWYYGNYLIIGGRNFYGPHYYLPILLPSVLLLGVALDDLTRRRPMIIGAAALAIVMGMAIEVGDKIDANAQARRSIAEEVSAVEAAVEGPSVVILPAGPDGAYILHPRGAFRNGPGLTDEILFAADLGARNAELIERFQGRRFHRFIERNDVVDRTTIEELQVVRGRRLRFHASRQIATEGGAIDLEVAVGDRSFVCTAADVSVELEALTALVLGCGPEPLPIALAHHTNEIRFSSRRIPDRLADPGGEKSDLIWDVAVTSGGSDGDLVTFAPPRAWVERNGSRWATTASTVPWMTSTVEVAGRTE